jgi:hypothetical protein
MDEHQSEVESILKEIRQWKDSLEFVKERERTIDLMRHDIYRLAKDYDMEDLGSEPFSLKNMMLEKLKEKRIRLAILRGE